MNSKRIILIVFCFVISVGMVLSLVMIYKSNTSKLNGFTRQIKPDIVSKINQFDLGYNSYYLAGISDDHIYLGNYLATSLLLKTNYDFSDTINFKFSPPHKINLVWEAVKLYVNPPHVYLMEGISPEILYARLPSTKTVSLEGLDKTYFASSIPLSNSSFILRVFDNRQEQYVLTKKVSGVPYDTHNAGILEKQKDGYFSVDGKLFYQSGTNRLVYLYNYRNEFIVLDSLLNVIHQGSTIDTISTAQIKVAELDGGKRHTLSAPPLLVNQNGCVNSEWLLINSALIADNEKKENFVKSSVIDVYSIEGGEYQFSFYLKNPENQKLSSIMLHKDILVVIFGNIICTYKTNIQYSKSIPN